MQWCGHRSAVVGHTEELHSSPQQLTTSLTAVPRTGRSCPVSRTLGRSLARVRPSQSSHWLINPAPHPCWSCLGFWVRAPPPPQVTCLQLRSRTWTLAPGPGEEWGGPGSWNNGHGDGRHGRVASGQETELDSSIRLPIVRSEHCCCCCGGAVAYSLNPSTTHWPTAI